MKKIISILLFICMESALMAQPKYVFLMFGDGMGFGSVSLAENYKAYCQGDSLGMVHLNFTDFPSMGFMSTQNANRLVTGSSEAATALFCGYKGKSGSVGIDAAGNPVESFLVTMHNRGYQVGIASTDPINHATPASTYAHTKSRGDFSGITRQLPAHGFEFLCGNSFVDFNKTDGDVNADDFMRNNGYQLYFGVKDFAERDKSARKVVLYNEHNRTFKSKITAEIDKTKKYELENYDRALTPAQMVNAALAHFDQSKPFVILCEEGDIDHSGHNLNAMRMTRSVLDLEGGVEAALEFYRAHPDETLIIVFSDHDTAAPTPGGPYRPRIKWEELENAPKRGVNETGDACNKANITMVSEHHTALPTPVFAIGKGAENFGGHYDNTDFYRRMMMTIFP